MKTYLVLDIETAPITDERRIDEIRETIKPPSTYKKPESIAEWHRAHGAEALREKVANTALKGMQGDIIAIGWKVAELNPVQDDTDGESWEDKEYAFAALEAHSTRVKLRDKDQKADGFLREIFDEIESVGRQVIVVGHNLVSFDLPFLWQQAVRHKVRWPSNLPVMPSNFDSRVLDTMVATVGHRNQISLRDAAKAMNIPWKENIPSAEIPDAWEHGELDKIIDHLQNDVDVTYRIAERLLYTTGLLGRDTNVER